MVKFYIQKNVKKKKQTHCHWKAMFYDRSTSWASSLLFSKIKQINHILVKSDLHDKIHFTVTKATFIKEIK